MKKLTYVILFALSFSSAMVFAKPDVKLDVVAEADVMVEENGKLVKKRMVIDKIEPGKEIIYTLKYKNEGDEPAKNVKLKNKIPDNTQFIAKSDWGKGSQTTYSIDGGKTFAKAKMLEVEVDDGSGKKIKKAATADQYTDIQWVVSEIPAGAEGDVGFKVKVN